MTDEWHWTGYALVGLVASFVLGVLSWLLYAVVTNLVAFATVVVAGAVTVGAWYLLGRLTVAAYRYLRSRTVLGGGKAGGRP